MKSAFILGAFIIAAGFTPSPLSPSEAFREGATWLMILTWAISLSPLLPLAAVVIRTSTPLQLNRPTALFIAVLTGILGLFVTVVIAGLSGAGTNLALMHGISLTVAVILSIRLLSTKAATLWAPKMLIFWSVPVVVGIWSLVSAASVAEQANRISHGHPFCLAPHDSRDVHSFADLRGLSFYTTSSGFKSTSHWFFHGILLVRNAGHIEAYNWSPRHMAFHHIERPETLVMPPIKVCTPQHGFWSTLSIF